MNIRFRKNAVFNDKAGGLCPTPVMGLYCWNKEWSSMTVSQQYKFWLQSSGLYCYIFLEVVKD